MDDRNAMKRGVIDTTLEFYNKNKTVITPFVAVNRKFLELLGIKTEIDSKVRFAGEVTAGKTSNKQAVKAALFTDTTEYSGILYSYALDNNNQELSAFCKLYPSDFKSMTDQGLSDFCHNVLSKLNLNIGFLADYGLTAEKITAYENLILEYDKARGAGRLSIKERKTANEQIEALIKQGMYLINEHLDSLMPAVKKENADVYNLYVAATELVNLGGSTESESTPEPPTPEPVPTPQQ